METYSLNMISVYNKAFLISRSWLTLSQTCEFSEWLTEDSLWPDHLNLYVFDTRTAEIHSNQFANESFCEICKLI